MSLDVLVDCWLRHADRYSSSFSDGSGIRLVQGRGSHSPARTGRRAALPPQIAAHEYGDWPMTCMYTGQDFPDRFGEVIMPITHEISRGKTMNTTIDTNILVNRVPHRRASDELGCLYTSYWPIQFKIPAGVQQNIQIGPL